MPLQDPLFFLGARGSGVGFHRHGEAWNAVIFGRKRWFLYPPEWRSSLLGVDPDQAVDGLGWFRSRYPILADTPMAPMECVTGVGDVFYFPVRACRSCHTCLGKPVQTVLLVVVVPLLLAVVVPLLLLLLLLLRLLLVLVLLLLC